MNPSKRQIKKNLSVANRLRNTNSKTIAAIVLVSVMALLWGRVLLKGHSGPASAGAAEIDNSLQIQTSVIKPVPLTPVKLAFVEGRHDVLTADVFSTVQWEALNAEPEEKAVVVVEDENEEEKLEKQRQQKMKKIEAMLKLDAVVRDANGKPQQVFVNDEILTVGSVLTVQEGPEQYELVLLGINENEVAFDWNGASISLKMTETVEK